MIRAIFFDFDGTISDSHSIISRALFDTINKNGYKVSKNKINDLIGDKVGVILKKLNITKGTKKIRDEFYRDLTEEMIKAKLYPCVDLKYLKDFHKKYITIVVSNAETSFTKLQAKKLKIDKYFNEIIGVEKSSSKDIMMIKLFKKYKLKPKEVIYIGDRYSDIEYSKKAKCWSIAISNSCSWSSKKVLIKSRPDFIIKDFYELKKVVERLESQKD